MALLVMVFLGFTGTTVLAQDVISGTTQDQSVTTAKIAYNAVTTTKIADGAVTNLKLDSSMQTLLNSLQSRIQKLEATVALLKAKR